MFCYIFVKDISENVNDVAVFIGVVSYINKNVVFREEIPSITVVIGCGAVIAVRREEIKVCLKFGLCVTKGAEIDTSAACNLSFAYMVFIIGNKGNDKTYDIV